MAFQACLLHAHVLAGTIHPTLLAHRSQGPCTAALLSHSAAVVAGQAWPDSRRFSHRSLASSTAIRARRRNSRQERDSEAEQSIDEPQIDLGRRAEAISSQLQLRPEHVRSLVRRNPAIAAVPLEKLRKGLPGLAHVLGVPLSQALFMVARQPGVLDADVQQLQRSCEQLAAAVQLPAEQVMFLAARQPALLASPARMAAEAQKLGAALGCSACGALQLLSRLGSEQLHSVLSMSSSTVLQRLPEVVEALGLPSDSTRKLDMLHLVAKHPGLLAASLGDIGRSTDALLVAFQQSPPLTFAAVLGRCPSLLTLPAEQILANYQGLLLQLGVSRGALARMLAKHPQLLRAAPESTAVKLRAMAFKLYLPQGQVVSMCVRQPALLSKDSGSLAAALASLQALLRCNYQAAVAAAVRAPNLLLWRPASLQRKHAMLLQATQLPAVRLNALLLQQPGLLTLSLGQLASCISCAQQLLQLSTAELGELLLKDPKLLIRGSRVLQEQVQELQEYLALPASTIADLLRRSPGILAAGSRCGWPTSPRCWRCCSSRRSRCRQQCWQSHN
ncbi:hypothetical protein COO60DRAFT_148194 [Scenedesmus sp. NREL 46B-D3]|nr:hypothetical protein COO60DRAFT_148194 [Scenedesmus sp. NREL 46B-D3]